MSRSRDPQRRLAVVSGGGTGIGKAIARALLTDGCEVIITGRRADVLETAAASLASQRPPGAGTVSFVAADLAEPAQVRAVAEAVDDRGGEVDIVVANAGGPAPRSNGELHEVADAWIAAYRSNVLTGVLLVHALGPKLTRPGGRIVLIGSSAALRGNANPAYVAAKAALHGYVLQLAASLGPDGITANVIAPGFTDGTDVIVGRITPERRERLVARIAAARVASPDEIAAVVRSVASRESSYLNGQVIAVDGGVQPT